MANASEKEEHARRQGRQGAAVVTTRAAIGVETMTATAQGGVGNMLLTGK